MRRLVCLAALAACAITPRPAPLRGDPMAGRVADPAASYLAARWLPVMPERAYCVTAYHVETVQPYGGRVLVVTDVEDAPADPTATPESVAVPGGCGGRPVIHTHPPGACHLSGLDLGTGLLRWGAPFIASQCAPARYTFAVLWDRVGRGGGR